MKRNEAKELIQKYIESWLKQNIDLFASTLHNDVIIKECYGPIYQGKKANIEWFKKWNVGSNIVSNWIITSFSYDSENMSCSFEWDLHVLLKIKSIAF